MIGVRLRAHGYADTGAMDFEFPVKVCGSWIGEGTGVGADVVLNDHAVEHGRKVAYKAVDALVLLVVETVGKRDGAEAPIENTGLAIPMGVVGKGEPAVARREKQECGED
jgi:hypothetical protein